MLNLSIIRHSSSSVTSSLLMVPKSDGTLRGCGDYRQHNKVTVPEGYPLPLISDLNLKLNRCRIFSKVHIVRSYHQIPIAEEDVIEQRLLHLLALLIFYGDVLEFVKQGCNSANF